MHDLFPNSETTIFWVANGNYGKIDESTSTKTAMEKIFETVFDGRCLDNANNENAPCR